MLCKRIMPLMLLALPALLPARALANGSGTVGGFQVYSDGFAFFLTG